MAAIFATFDQTTATLEVISAGIVIRSAERFGGTLTGHLEHWGYVATSVWSQLADGTHYAEITYA